MLSRLVRWGPGRGALVTTTLTVALLVYATPHSPLQSRRIFHFSSSRMSTDHSMLDGADEGASCLITAESVAGGLSTGCATPKDWMPSGPLPVMGDESLMAPKAHGSCAGPLQANLRFGVDPKTADKICCFNRHYAEHAGYFMVTDWLKSVPRDKPIDYYCPLTGKRLFSAPLKRSFDAFHKESKSHGWPSFRDDEVNWEFVRCLPDGECVTVDGVHLGHNIPDRHGNRYCINLVSCAGNTAE